MRGRTSFGPGRLWKREQAGGAAWVLDWRTEHGVRRRDHLGPNKREAEAQQSELIARRNRRMRGLEVEEQDIALADLRDRYLADLSTRASRMHVRNVELQLKRLLQSLPARTVRQLKPSHLLDYRNELSREGASNRTLNVHSQAIRGMLRWAVDAELIARNPLERVRKVPDTGKHSVRPRRAMTDAELGSFLDAAEAEDERLAKLGPRVPQTPLWVALVGTGARYGELVRSTWADLDEQRRFLRLRAAETKANRERLVPLREDLVERLHRMRAVHAVVLGRVPGPGDRIFLTPTGSHWPRPSNNVGRLFARLLKAAAIDKVDSNGERLDVHSLRYTALTRLARAGVPLAHTQRIAGHSTPALTARIYVRLDAESLRDAVDSVPSLAR